MKRTFKVTVIVIERHTGKVFRDDVEVTLSTVTGLLVTVAQMALMVWERFEDFWEKKSSMGMME